ncbi:hypothetical protein IQ26_04771 [Mesorhizobium tianshanense]|uniref:Uncharacterized protein n=1 Tax=Mesorhizobium tianshanense TaxID=39844 RepID=A0A562NFS0_9HYPH|nr:hypothetical protein IQ26_04771 [Mesorhizobium tianshanense]
MVSRPGEYRKRNSVWNTPVSNDAIGSATKPLNSFTHLEAGGVAGA